MGFGAALGGALGGIFSGDDGMGDRQRAENLIAQVKDPNFNFDTLKPEDLRVLQQYAPETLERANLAPAQQIQTDPRLRDMQMQAAKSMMDKANQGGLDMQARSQLNDVNNSQASENKGQQDAVIASLASRGQMGGGQEAAMRMMAQQGSADRASDQGMNVASQGQQRALQAMMQGSSMAGQMRGQDFQTNSANSDMINRFNELNFRNQQDLMNQNTQNANSAQKFNLENNQDINNQNVANRNAYAKYNQANFNNLQGQLSNFRLARATGQANQVNNQATNQDARQAANAQRWVGMGEGAEDGAKMAFGKPPGGG